MKLVFHVNSTSKSMQNIANMTTAMMMMILPEMVYRTWLIWCRQGRGWRCRSWWPSEKIHQCSIIHEKWTSLKCNILPGQNLWFKIFEKCPHILLIQHCHTKVKPKEMSKRTFGSSSWRSFSHFKSFCSTKSHWKLLIYKITFAWILFCNLTNSHWIQKYSPIELFCLHGSSLQKWIFFYFHFSSLGMKN